MSDFDLSGVKHIQDVQAICAFCADGVLINKCLLADFVVEVCNALVGPVFPQCGQDVTQSVGPGYKHTYVTLRHVSTGFSLVLKIQKCMSWTKKSEG